jgi:hypothetical protein
MATGFDQREALVFAYFLDITAKTSKGTRRTDFFMFYLLKNPEPFAPQSPS